MRGRYDRVRMIFVLMSLTLLGGLCMSAYAVNPTYTYDVTPTGMVHVTIHPGNASTLFIPVTAENLNVSGVTCSSSKDWKNFRTELKLRRPTDGAVITYDWPDGALTWPEKRSMSTLLRDLENKWYTDNFYSEGPCEVTIILPLKAEVVTWKELDCPYRTETGSDGRVRVTFDVPAWRKTTWMGVAYRYPWADTYSTYGKSPLILRYPTVMGKYPEYMAKIKDFYNACWGFYHTYKNEMSWAPPFDITIDFDSWVQGYGAAFTTGRGIIFNYRSVTGFEYPPVTDGNRLMGAYHEMSHIFQPAGYPEFIGGHTWSCFHTMLYDWNDCEAGDIIAQRKAAGDTPDKIIIDGRREYEKLFAKGVVPATWLRWPDDIDEKIKAAGCDWNGGQLHEKSQSYVMLRLERDYGKSFWGKYAQVFIDSGITYDPIDEPVKQKIVAAQMSRAAGQDLTDYLSKLSNLDLTVKIEGEGKNLLPEGTMDKDGGWKLESVKPGAKMVWDNNSGHYGKGCLKLTCADDNDARAMQTVKVQPNTYYLLSAWVKTDVPLGISGGCLSVSGDRGTIPQIGSTGWQQRALPFYSEDATEIDVQLRLGWSDMPTTGTVYFDDVKLYPLFSKNGWDHFNKLGIAKG